VIDYRDIKEIDQSQLQALFLSVGWSSGHFPEKLAAALKNYGSVITAWDSGKLAGLVSAMDDGVMTAYIHYMLVDPAYQKQGIGEELMRRTMEYYADYLRVLLVAYDKEIGFYEHCGFKAGESKTVMEITSLWT
jgi:ribosomal protein S18 acetylase RimI-like enzyme